MVTQITVNRKSRRAERRQRQIGNDISISESNRASRTEKHALPHSRVAVGHEWDVHLMLGIVVADVLPIYPVEPAIGQLNGMVADHNPAFEQHSSFPAHLPTNHIA